MECMGWDGLWCRVTEVGPYWFSNFVGTQNGWSEVSAKGTREAVGLRANAEEGCARSVQV